MGILTPPCTGKTGCLLVELYISCISGSNKKVTMLSSATQLKEVNIKVICTGNLSCVCVGVKRVKIKTAFPNSYPAKCSMLYIRA